MAGCDAQSAGDAQGSRDQGIAEISIHTSYSEKLALDNSEAVRDVVKSHTFREIFDIRTKKDFSLFPDILNHVRYRLFWKIVGYRYFH